MKRNFLFLLFVVSSMLRSLIVTAQIENEHSYPNIGIPVTLDEFNRMVREMMITVRRGKDLTTTEFIAVVRIDNTIHLNTVLPPNKLYSGFSNLLTAKYEDAIEKRMDSGVGVGFSFYSKKYKLYWGGKPDSNSMFKIVKFVRPNHEKQ